MSAPTKQAPMPAKHAANSSTPPAISSTPLKRSRWQLTAASVMLALWIVFLIAMAIYS